MKWLLVLGAHSDIARATASRFAAAGWSLYLAGRRPAELERDAADLAIRHAVQARALALDALDYRAHAAFYAALPEKPEAVLCAVGLLGNNEQPAFSEIEAIIAANFTGCVSLLEIVAADFAARASGSILAISSVAGDRGRQSNFYYGSAKAGLTTYLAGLRNRLHRRGVHVLTIKPGFTATAMTAHLKLPPRLTATPQKVAEDIYRAYRKRRDQLYTPWFWRWIMLAIRCLPEPLFKRLNL